MPGALPNLRNIFSSFRSPKEELDYSRSAFYKFLGFVLVSMGMSLAAIANLNGARAKKALMG